MTGMKGQTMNIVVVGIGYVGLSNAALLAQNNTVVAVDISEERVAQVNNRQCPIIDAELEDFLSSKHLDLRATTDLISAASNADIVIVATPTDYDPKTNFFDTSSVENVVHQVSKIAPEATIIIKSTIPVGFVQRLRVETGNTNIIFSPEFLREGRALYDNLYPSRIIVGDRRGFCQTSSGRSSRRKCPPFIRCPFRGRGDKAVREHLPCDAGCVLQ